MRILYFSRNYTPHDYRFLTSLVHAGHEVHHLRLENSSRSSEQRQLPREVNQHALTSVGKVYSLSGLIDYRKKLTQLLDQLQPDLVHAGPIQSPAFLVAASGFQPLISMSWGSDILVEAERNMAMRMITRYTLRRSSLLFCDCQVVLEKATRIGFPRDNIVTFPWGVNLDDFKPGGDGGLRSRMGWARDGEFVLLSLRSWEPIYGVDVAVRGFILAANKLPNLRLILLGEGSQGGMIKDMIKHAGLLGRVHFGGQVAYGELANYYRAADLYLSASHSDGSSVSLMEALASGTPVLVSDIPGNLEWVQNGREGWLFPDGDEDKLAERIQWAENHPQDLAGMSKAARLRAEERADWSKNFERMIQGYRKATGMG